MKKNRVFINEYDSYSCAGDTIELMEAIYHKNVCISQSNHYIKDKEVAIGIFKHGEFFEHLESITEAILEASTLEDFSNTLLIVGSSVGGMQKSEQTFFKDNSYKNINVDEHDISVITTFLDKKYNFTSTRAISTACTSSANALLLAKRLIELGAYKSILVVGADALCYTTVCGFNALGVLSTKPSTPFSIGREGMNVAEAVAILHLQDEMGEDAIELCGAGASSDAFHITQPDPEAKGAMSAMKNALIDANIDSDKIDYINAHGTGTQANDITEALGCELVFTHNPPLSSTKAVTGHTLGAAGALEAVISCEVIKRGLVPAQVSLEKIENENVNLPHENIEQNVKYVVSNSFAFGGNNTALVFGAIS